MMANSIKTILAFALLVGVASQANANDWHHVDQMALKIQSKTNQLTRESEHYRYSRHHRRLVACTHRLAELSALTSDIAHHGHSLVSLKKYVYEMDSLFHEVEGLFDHIEESAARGKGRVRGNTAHVKRLLNSIEDCIHYLQDDLRYLTRASQKVKVKRTSYSKGGAYGKSYQRGHSVYGGKSYGGYGKKSYGHGKRSYHNAKNKGGFGISIGGGSSRISIRF